MRYFQGEDTKEILNDEMNWIGQIGDFESEEHKSWYQKVLVSLRKTMPVQEKEHSELLDVTIELRKAVSGVYKIYMGLNQLIFLFRADELLIKRYFSLFEEQHLDDEGKLDNVTLHEFCQRFANYMVMQTRGMALIH